jgi:hypothetical protein
MRMPRPGQVEDGYVFIGGDPGEEASWKQVNPEDLFDPTEGMSGTEKFLAGVGGGMVRTGRTAASFLPEAVRPEWASKEAIAEQDYTDQALNDTGAGFAGNIVGQMAATAPIGGAVGLGANVGRGMLAGQGIRQAATQAMPMAMKARMATGGLQGAVEGAALAGRDDAASGALIGGGIGAGAGAIGGLTRAARQKVFPRLTDEAKHLQDLPIGQVGEGIQVPIAQGAERGLWKSLFSEGMSNLPGTQGMLRGQREKVVKQLNDYIFENALPSNPSPAARQAIEGTTKIDDMMGIAQKEWGNAFNSFDNLNLKLPRGKVFDDEAVELLNKAWEKAGSPMRVPKPGQVVTGKDAANLRQAATDLIDEMVKKKGKTFTKHRSNLLQKFRQDVDNVLKSYMNPKAKPGSGTARTTDTIQTYFNDRGQYENWIKLRRAVGKGSDLNYGKLAQAHKVGEPMRETATAAQSALKSAAGEGNIYQVLAAASILAPGLLTALNKGDPVEGVKASGLTFGTMLALATPAGQRALLRAGSPNDQSKIAALLRVLGQQGRAGAIVGAENASR